MQFIEVMVADEEIVMINVDEIACVKSKRVDLSEKNNKQIMGCVIERKSSPYAVWCVEPKDAVKERMREAGAVVVRQGEEL